MLLEWDLTERIAIIIIQSLLLLFSQPWHQPVFPCICGAVATTTMEVTTASHICTFHSYSHSFHNVKWPGLTTNFLFFPLTSKLLNSLIPRYCSKNILCLNSITVVNCWGIQSQHCDVWLYSDMFSLDLHCLFSTVDLNSFSHFVIDN